VTRWQVFEQGLTITGVGMGLVFLTLILVAVVIWALSKAFPPKPEAEEEDEEAEAESPVVPLELAEDDGADQAAAVAVAMALQSLQARPAVAAAVPGGAHVAMPLPWQAVTEIDDEEITGEVVKVSGITGSASWKARGRLTGRK